MAERGDTLWGLADTLYDNGNRWTEFGFKRDPRTLQIGEVIKVGGGNNTTTTSSKTTSSIVFPTLPSKPQEPPKPPFEPGLSMHEKITEYSVFVNYSEYTKYFSQKDIAKASSEMEAEAMRRILAGKPLNIYISRTLLALKNQKANTIYIRFSNGSGEDKAKHGGGSNPYYQVRNSYRIKNRGVMMAVIDFILQYNVYNPLYALTSDGKINTSVRWGRTRESLLMEWKMHNWGSPFLERCIHVDFDNDNKDGLL